MSPRGLCPRGFLGTYVPRDVKKESAPRDYPVGGCHPEHSEGAHMALLLFAQDEKRNGRKKRGDRPPFKIRQKKV